MAATLLILLFCACLLGKQKQQIAIPIFICTITAMFPALFLFGGMFGSRRLFLFYCWLSWHFLVGLSLLKSGVGTPYAMCAPNMVHFIHISAILIATSFFFCVLASDLRKAINDLNNSKKELQELNEELEIRVKKRTEQYESANKALQESKSKLETAHNELVNSERLASLGSMVAGISHELNTPIGNVLLAATSMEKIIVETIENSKTGTFKRSTLNDFLEASLEISLLISRSNKRAADLVASFKQVAVDQTSEQRRIFDLKEVVEDNLSTLLPRYSKSSIQVESIVRGGIEFNSYPGPLGQVITNLVSTTKLGQGGSGLGLSISHRIATSVLGGEIGVESPPGTGALFKMTLPICALQSLKHPFQNTVTINECMF